MPEETESDLLRIHEAASYLRCSVATVRRLIDRGELPVLRLGGLVRIRRGDLEALPTQFARTT